MCKSCRKTASGCTSVSASSTAPQISQTLGMSVVTSGDFKSRFEQGLLEISHGRGVFIILKSDFLACEADFLNRSDAPHFVQGVTHLLGRRFVIQTWHSDRFGFHRSNSFLLHVLRVTDG